MSSLEKTDLPKNELQIDSEFLREEPLEISNFEESSSSQGPQPSGSRWRKFKDSFKPLDEAVVTDDMSDIEKIAHRTAHAPLKHH